MNSSTIDEGLKMGGVYTITKATLESRRQRLYYAYLLLRRKIGLSYIKQVRKLNSMCAVEVSTFKNIVPTVARTMIANNLTSASPTNVMKITHVALGSSSTAVANGDTQLGTEVYRNAVASLVNANNIAYATGFFTATETSGTYAELGFFSNGSGTANSGVIVSHVLAAITKTTSQTLTVDLALTIS